MRHTLLPLGLVWFLSATTGFTQQVLPEGLNSLPVLIQIPMPDGHTGVGTGVYLTRSNKCFLVTAKHVIFDMTSTRPLPLRNTNAILAAYAQSLTNNHKSIIYYDLKVANELGLIHQHATRDIVALYVATFTNVGGDFVYNNKIMRLEPRGELDSYSGDVFVNSAYVYEGSELLILGYPIELLKQAAQVDFSRPLIRRGIISQKNRQTGKFIIDSGVYGGNSGGPVLVVQHPAHDVTSYKIAGIMVEFVPAETRIFPNMGYTNSVLVFSGYSVAEPIEAAFELLL